MEQLQEQMHTHTPAHAHANCHPVAIFCLLLLALLALLSRTFLLYCFINLNLVPISGATEDAMQTEAFMLKSD